MQRAKGMIRYGHNTYRSIAQLSILLWIRTGWSSFLCLGGQGAAEGRTRTTTM